MIDDDIPYEPQCRDCRADAGKANALTTWVCGAHVRRRLTDEVLGYRRACISYEQTVRDLRAALAAEEAAHRRERDELRAEADEWAMRADGVVHNPNCTDDLPCLRCRAEQAELQRDEARALLREIATDYPTWHDRDMDDWLARIAAYLGPEVTR